LSKAFNGTTNGEPSSYRDAQQPEPNQKHAELGQLIVARQPGKTALL